VKDKIQELLGLGLPNHVVASAVGVSESYISQLVSDSEFAQAVQELRLKNLTEAAGRDRKWNSLEDALLMKLDNLMDMSFTRPMEVIKALAVVNSAKRRAAPQELSATANAVVIPLILPIVLAPKLSLNDQGQVIEVEGRIIATMPANVVNAKLDELKKKNEKEVGAVNQKLLEEDKEAARIRLSTLQKMNALPVHELI